MVSYCTCVLGPHLMEKTGKGYQYFIVLKYILLTLIVTNKFVWVLVLNAFQTADTICIATGIVFAIFQYNSPLREIKLNLLFC